MKINVRPNLDQIRFFARTAMHAWDYQDLAAGKAQVIRDMERLLAYLDAFDHGEGVVVTAISRIEAGVSIERSTREGDVLNLVDRYISQNVMRYVDNRSPSPRYGTLGWQPDKDASKIGSTVSSEFLNVRNM